MGFKKSSKFSKFMHTLSTSINREVFPFRIDAPGYGYTYQVNSIIFVGRWLTYHHFRVQGSNSFVASLHILLVFTMISSSQPKYSNDPNFRYALRKLKTGI